MIPIPSQTPDRRARCALAGRVAAWVVAGAMMVWGTAHAQDYLSADRTAPKSLEEQPSSFERFGQRDYLLFPPPKPVVRRFLGQYGPFFGDAVFKLEPRAYYRYRTDPGMIHEALATGGSLEFHSGWWRDFLRVGLAGYASVPLHAPKDRDGTGLLREQQKEYHVLGEAYVHAKLSRSEVLLYRQSFNTPFVNQDDSRMSPNTFEAYTFDFKEIPNLIIGGGHVTRMKERNSGSFVPMAEVAGAEGANDGVTSLGIGYGDLKGAHVGFMNHYGWNTFNTFYSEAAWFQEFTDDLSVRTTLQFADQRSVGDELIGEFDTRVAGAKAAVGWGSLIGTVAVTAVSEGGDIISPWGGSPTFNSMMIGGFEQAGEKAIRFGISRDFSDWGLDGLSSFTNFVIGHTPDTGPAASYNEKEYNITLDYRPAREGPFKHFWLRARGAWNDRSNGEFREDYRVILNYQRKF